MNLQQQQVQRLNQQQLQSVELLQMSAIELEQYIQELALENPVIEPEESAPTADAVSPNDVLGRLSWLEEADHQNYYYQRVDLEEWDPLVRASTAGGLEETLTRFLSRQLDRLSLGEEKTQVALYLASCLDDYGYFHHSLDELSEESGIPRAQLEQGLDTLRSLEPAGVGASSLSECLTLQLQRIQETGPAMAIARDHLELLGKRRYRAIASKLHIPVTEVLEAEKIIRELEPRPGAIFQQPGHTPYILPDIIVQEVDGRFVAQSRRGDRPFFHISSYYRTLLSQTEDAEVKEYLTAKLRQAETVLWALDQRGSTLVRCAQAIVDHQAAFFRSGPAALVPLNMTELGGQIGVHESTVSRTVREKYLQCARGVYPLSYFFSQSATGQGGQDAMSGKAAQALLRQLIDGEDKAAPLSDQKLSELMAAKGCPISRRTVAKYRDEMNLPGAAGRRVC